MDTSSPHEASAEQLLGDAFRSRLADFHLDYSGHRSAVGALQKRFAARFDGSGQVVLGAQLLAHVEDHNWFCADGCPTELIVAGADRYSRSPGSSWWLDENIGPDSYPWSLILPVRLAEATAARVLRREVINGAVAWVVEAKDSGGHTFQVWLRESDGFPLHLASAPNDITSFLDLTIDLSQFNRGTVITVPSKRQLNPIFWGTEYGRERPFPVAGGTVTVHNPQFDCSGGNLVDDSRPDAYPMLVTFTYQAGPSPMRIDPPAWTLYDPHGTPYQPQSVSASGALCYLVPWNQDGMVLVGEFNGTVVTVFMGGLRATHQADRSASVGETADARSAG